MSAIELLIQAFPALQATYLFGSAGTAYERPDSDVDLAILASRPESPIEVWQTAQRIACVVGRDVDLVDLRRATTVMAAHIITDGERPMCLDLNESATFEMHILADYARLNEERAGILADIEKRGAAHAG